MNALTSLGQGGRRNQQHDVLGVVGTHRYIAAPYLAARERQLGWQAEAEQDWLKRQSAPAATAAISRFTSLCRSIASTLVRLGQQLAPDRPSEVPAPPAARASTFNVAIGGSGRDC